MKPSTKLVALSQFLFLVRATAVAMSPPGILNYQGDINTNGLGFVRGKRNQQPADYKL